MGRLRRPPVWGVVLATILVAGFALRADSAMHPDRVIGADEQAYASLSINVAQHAKYDVPGALEPLRWAPGTPVLFAAARRLTGEETGVKAPVQFWAQAVVGTATIAAAFALAFLLAGAWAGVAAAAAVAFYPPYVTITGDLVSEPLGALTLTLAMALLAWAWGTRRMDRLGMAGFALGIAVLVRADLLIVPFLVALLLLVARQGRRGVAAFMVGAALAAGPWIAMASITSHKLVPVTTGSSGTLFVATYLPGHGTIWGMRRALAGPYRAAHPQRRHLADGRIRSEWLLSWIAQSRHPGMARDAALQREVWRNLRYDLHRPRQFADMSLDKLQRLWLGYDRAHRPRNAWILRWHLVLVGLAFAGVLLGLWRRRDGRLAVLLAVLAAVTLVNAFFVAEARHNARMLPVLVGAGAAGWALAVRAPVRARAGRREPAGPGVASAS